MSHPLVRSGARQGWHRGGLVGGGGDPALPERHGGRGRDDEQAAPSEWREECAGNVRDRPSATCATNRLRARESLISRTVAHRRAPSRHPHLRMAFKRSWVRLHSGHFYLLNRHDLPGILASRWLAECPLGRFLLFGARAIGGSRSELPGQLRLALLWRLGARLWETTRGMCRSRPGHQGGEMGTARTRLRSGAARYRVGA
jgi:hypothetical protein